MSRVGRRQKRVLSPKQTAWVRSVKFRAAARQGLALGLAARLAAKRCGAKAKSTGEPCRAPALENGRCGAHGGKTPRGDQWHRVQLDRAKTPTALAKLDSKITKRAAEAKARQRRLEHMTPEDRERHEAWQQSHKPGSAGQRAAQRAERKQNEWLREFVNETTPVTQKPELESAQMKDVFDYLDDLPTGAVRDEVLRLVRNEGVVAAVRAAIDVLNDSKATAAARATMAALMFRLAGYLEKPAEADDPYGFSKMSPSKLQAEADKLDQEIAERARLISQIDADVDIFA